MKSRWLALCIVFGNACAATSNDDAFEASSASGLLASSSVDVHRATARDVPPLPFDCGDGFAMNSLSAKRSQKSGTDRRWVLCQNPFPDLSTVALVEVEREKTSNEPRARRVVFFSERDTQASVAEVITGYLNLGGLPSLASVSGSQVALLTRQVDENAWVVAPDGARRVASENVVDERESAWDPGVRERATLGDCAHWVAYTAAFGIVFYVLYAYTIEQGRECFSENDTERVVASRMGQPLPACGPSQYAMLSLETVGLIGAFAALAASGDSFVRCMKDGYRLFHGEPPPR